MTDIASQLFGLTGRLIGFLLNWPFLLFVFLFWVVNRYRDQIGSMLDRRGAVKAAVLSKAVKRELEPVSKQLESMMAGISALRYDVDRLEAVQADEKLTAALEDIPKQLAALEGRFAEARADSERLLRNELSEAVTGEREAVGQELTKVGEALVAQQCQLTTLAPREVVDALAAVLAPTRAELAAVTDAIALLRAQVDVGASKDEVERLDRESGSIKSAVDQVNGVVRALETSMKSVPEQLERLAGQVETVTRDLNAVQATIDRLERGSDAPITPGATTMAAPVEEGGPVPLNMMKQELALPRWIWRRVETLAKTAEISEDEAFSILSASPDVTVGTNSKGERIAKLATR